MNAANWPPAGIVLLAVPPATSFPLSSLSVKSTVCSAGSVLRTAIPVLSPPPRRAGATAIRSLGLAATPVIPVPTRSKRTTAETGTLSVETVIDPVNGRIGHWKNRGQSPFLALPIIPSRR